jgi:hypothetical protein
VRSRNSVSLHDLVRTSLGGSNGHCYAVATPSARVLADAADLHLARELAPLGGSSAPTESVVAVVERVRQDVDTALAGVIQAETGLVVFGYGEHSVVVTGGDGRTSLRDGHGLFPLGTGVVIGTPSDGEGQVDFTGGTVRSDGMGVEPLEPGSAALTDPDRPQGEASPKAESMDRRGAGSDLVSLEFDVASPTNLLLATPRNPSSAHLEPFVAPEDAHGDGTEFGVSAGEPGDEFQPVSIGRRGPPGDVPDEQFEGGSAEAGDISGTSDAEATAAEEEVPGVGESESMTAPQQAVSAGSLISTLRSASQGDGASIAAVGLPEAATGAFVEGVTCPRGHFTDPAASMCRWCDEPLGLAPSATGPRPPLIRLGLPDGRVIDVVTSIRLGRAPTATEADLASGALTTVMLPAEQHLSRNHLDIIVNGWSVTANDLGSANGSSYRGDFGEVALVAHVPTPIEPGGMLMLGTVAVELLSA